MYTSKSEEIREPALPVAWERKKADLLYELQLAISRTSGEELAVWAKEAVARLFWVGKRRGKNLFHLVKNLIGGTIEEIGGAGLAFGKGNLIEHLSKRSGAAADVAGDFLVQSYQALKQMSSALIADPKKNAPEVFALGLGFLVGSGGVDANGGLPDVDIPLGGIGAHRSILTHSVLMGMVIEASVLALADLAGIVCNKLPPGQRSEFWEILSTTKDQIAEKFACGASLGIGYHLGIDATLQEAPYKDLPISLSMEAHQVIMGTNAVAEINDAMRPRTLEEARENVTRARREFMAHKGHESSELRARLNAAVAEKRRFERAAINVGRIARAAR
jgi:hypothetical protein